jgi:hypothetical protein
VAQKDQQTEPSQPNAVPGQHTSSPRRGNSEAASSKRQYTSSSAGNHPLEQARARTHDRTAYGDLSDILHPDDDLSGLEKLDPFIDHRPVNQPLQVQPPREHTLKEATGFQGDSGRTIDEHVDKSTATHVAEYAEDQSCNDRDASSAAHVPDDASDADDGEYVVVGDEDAVADDTRDFHIATAAVEMSS